MSWTFRLTGSWEYRWIQKSKKDFGGSKKVPIEWRNSRCLLKYPKQLSCSYLMVNHLSLSLWNASANPMLIRFSACLSGTFPFFKESKTYQHTHSHTLPPTPTHTHNHRYVLKHNSWQIGVKDPGSFGWPFPRPSGSTPLHAQRNTIEIRKELLGHRHLSFTSLTLFEMYSLPHTQRIYYHNMQSGKWTILERNKFLAWYSFVFPEQALSLKYMAWFCVQIYFVPPRSTYP